MNPGGPRTAPPEEKLLRLIRGKPAGTATAQPAGSLPVLGGGVRVAVPSWVLVMINVVLGMVLVAEAIVIGLMLTSPVSSVAPLSPAPAAAGAEPAVQEPAPSLAAAVSRQIFEVPQAQATKDPDVAPPVVKPRSGDTQQLASQLKLIGVVTGDPSQAIIEDGQKTHFLSVGQTLPQGAVIKEIRDNRVVLEVNGETFELSL